MKKQPVRPLRKHFIATGIALFILINLFLCMPVTGHSTKPSIPSFGEGNIKVRIYTDYFCPPCRDMEPGIEPVITELVKDKIINLTFADTPFYRNSALYVRYFLYAINEKKDFEHVLYVRRSLIEASHYMVDNEERLAAFLKGKKIILKPFDPKPVFTALTNHLKEDQIEATPTCVIEMDGKKNKYVGAADIIGALNQLKKKRKR